MKQTRKGMDRNGSSSFVMGQICPPDMIQHHSWGMAQICSPVHDEVETWACGMLCSAYLQTKDT